MKGYKSDASDGIFFFYRTWYFYSSFRYFIFLKRFAWNGVILATGKYEVQ